MARAQSLAAESAIAETEQLHSSRRREKARAGSPDHFADPTSQRLSYEQVTSARDALNPVCKELYLEDDDFLRIFQVDKVSFYSMKLWKQRDLKRRVGLF